MWAHERQPDRVAYGAALGHEWFSPRELLDQAVKAERAEFDLACGSDHLAPWRDPSGVPPAHCANAWVWLGVPGQVTSEVSLGPAVSAIAR
jgi:coenzyme F420-dependent glucose-6-phosphate dehydrogenase